jgi:hypothetical protein
LATDGTLLPLVPFELALFPLELRVQADRQTGLFSGDFEVGVLIKPGPTQYRSAEVTDLVRLYVTGDPQVQFFSQLPYKDAPDPLEMSITPIHWDLKTGFFYDLTCEVYLTNRSSQDQVMGLVSSVSHLDGVNQVVSTLERGTILVRSGTTEVVLLALTVSAYQAARSDVTVTAATVDGKTTLLQRVMVNCDPNAQSPVFYQIMTASTLTIHRNTSVSMQFSTANGEEGPEIWGVNDPEFLSDHGMRFTASGVLKSDGNVLGPLTEHSVLFTVRKETGVRTRQYATKVIDLVITT